MGNQAMLILAFGVILFVLFYGLLQRIFRMQMITSASGAPNRWNQTTRPAVGGIGFILALLCGWGWDLLGKDELTRVDWLIPAGAIIAFVTGMRDDLKPLSPLKKFIGQAIAASCLLLSDCDMVHVHPVADIALKFILITGMMNSLNMLDNMDGVAGIAALSIVVWAASGEGGMPALLLIAALIGYLLYNRHPSVLFMGDSGSLTIGYALSYFILNSGVPSGQAFVGFSLVIPVLVLSLFALPLADSLVVTINRIAHGVSPFSGGRDHSTHHLVYAGWTEGGVTRFFICICAVEILLGYVFVSHWTLNPGLHNNEWIVFLALGFFVLLFSFLWTVSLRNLQKQRYRYTK